MSETKQQILDLTVTVVLFFTGCWVGAYVMKRHDTWIAFNGPALGIVGIGELIWWRVRRRINMGSNSRNIL